MITVLLVCNNIVNIAGSVIATDISLKIFSQNALAYATGIMTFLILVFGEIVPKSFATNHADKISLIMSPIIRILSIILYPIIIFFDFITVKVFRVTVSSPKLTEEEVRNIIDVAEKEGGIDEIEKSMIHKIFKFDDIDANKIRIPRTDMVMLDSNSSLEDALKLTKIYSRIPVYENNKDRIIGIFYFKDALEFLRQKKYDVPLKKLIRKPIFIPGTKKIDETLRLFQREKQLMAIIVDEHGGVAGLLTIEDILEEIVGDIADEHEDEEKSLEKVGKNTYKVLGKTDIEEINKILEIDLEKKSEYDTLSGYILDQLGRIPTEGEEINLASVKIDIQKIQGNRIIEVLLKKK